MRLLKRVALAMLLLVSAVIAASDPDTEIRREFQQAYTLTTAGGTTATTADSAALQAYVLYPYLQAARLRQALMKVDRDVAAVDQSIRTFLLAQNGSVASRELRRAWLLDLAARQQWSEFLLHVPTTTDAELRCHSIAAQLAVATTLPDAEPVRTAWLTAERLPPVCNGPFAWARSKQIITDELIEQRARLALKAGNVALARDLAAMLSPTRAAPLNQWARLIEQPQSAIDALLANPAIDVDAAALQDGWMRLARKDQDAAIERLPRLIRARQLTEAQASPYALSLALALSWSRRDETLRYFSRVAAVDMTDAAHEWRVRAALWAGKWQQVRQFILDMPEALRTQARWRYWLARAHAQLHSVSKARDLYQGLVAGDDNYYAAMAAAKLSVAYAPHPQALNVDADSMQSLLKLPGMQRARELVLVQLRSEAATEWNQVFATLQPGEHLAAAQLAHSWGWYDQAVATTAKLGLFNDYVFLYPQPYDAEVDAAVRRSSVPADLIYAVMRQETLFRADARSGANARGLLQLLPQTARLTARKFGLPIPSADDLYQPAVNVPLGAVYLKSLLDDFGGQVPLALASYNAGPNAVRRWLPTQPMEPDRWIENIPFNETRSYVQRVMWHSLVFRWLRTGEAVDTQSWQAKIQP